MGSLFRGYRYLTDVILKIGLELLLRVMQTGPHRAHRALHDVRDLLMAKLINLKQGDDGPMLERQFLECFVQFFLQLLEDCLLPIGGLHHQGLEEFGVAVFLHHLFEAEEAAHPRAAQVTEGGVDGDPVEPAEERGITLEPGDGLKRLDERFLRQIGGIFAIGGLSLPKK